MRLRRAIAVMCVIFAALYMTGCVKDLKKTFNEELNKAAKKEVEKEQETAKAETPKVEKKKPIVTKKAEPKVPSKYTQKGPTIGKETIPADTDPIIKKYIEGLYDDDKGKRRQAAYDLKNQRVKGAAAIPFLVTMTLDEDEGVRRLVAEALGAIGVGDASIIEPLSILIKDDFYNARMNAATSFISAKLLDPKVIDILMGSFDDENKFVRDAVGAAISRQGEPAIAPVINALKSENNLVRTTAASALYSFKQNKKTTDLVSTDLLISALKDDFADVRYWASMSFSKVDEDRVFDLFVDLLRDEDKRVRSIAAGLYRDKARKNYPLAVEPLISMLKNKDEDKGTRGTAAGALSTLKDPRALEPLIATLNDPELRLRKTAIQSLKKFNDPKAVEPLIALLGDPDDNIRMLSAETLGAHKDPRSVEPLIKLLGDKNRYVFETAATSLGIIGDPRGIEPLINIIKADAAAGKKLMEKDKVFSALTKFIDPRIPEVFALVLKDESVKSYKKGSVLDALSKYEVDLVADILIDTLNDKDNSAKIRAIDTMGKFADARFIKPLEDINNGDATSLVKTKATEALKKINSK